MTPSDLVSSSLHATRGSCPRLLFLLDVDVDVEVDAEAMPYQCGLGQLFKPAYPSRLAL